MENPSLVGKKFPSITAKSLSGKPTTLPDAAVGKITLVAIGFVQNSQYQIDTWAKPFQNRYGQNSDYVYYEVPIISNNYTLFGLMNGYIDAGMASGIPKPMHDYVLTFYGNTKPYISQYHVTNSKNAYIFVLDRQGIVRFVAEGFMDAKKEAEFWGAVEGVE